MDTTRLNSMVKGSVIDETGQYRYSLIREWDDGPRVLFIMLNPSTADAEVDDPTIRRCIGFAKRWNFGSLEVVNLFAYRATNPKQMYGVTDPAGPLNDLYITEAAVRATQIILAWGNVQRGVMPCTLTLLKDYPLYCLGTTKDGHPRHPLYLKNTVTPILYHGGA